MVLGPFRVLWSRSSERGASEPLYMPLSREHDYDATAGDEIDESAADLDDNAHAASGVLSVIERVDIASSLYELN
jgi:hypothetical protein